MAPDRKAVAALAAWMEENIPEGLTVFDLPASNRRRLRTTNMLERRNRELKRRTRVATLFPNVASLLRLVTGVLTETQRRMGDQQALRDLRNQIGAPPPLSYLCRKNGTESATRYEKTARNYLGFIQLAALLVWLK